MKTSKPSLRHPQTFGTGIRPWRKCSRAWRQWASVIRTRVPY